MTIIGKAFISSILILLGALVALHGQNSDKSANCGLQPSRKIDEYGTIAREDEKERLEKLLAALAAEKDSHAFIVTYGGRFSRRGEAQKRADWAKRYLVEKYGFFSGAEVTNAHLNTLTCGYRDIPSTELWLTPVGAAPPRCSPTISITERKSRLRPLRRRRR